MSAPPALLELREVSKSFASSATMMDRLSHRPPPVLQAVRGVSFVLEPGRTLGVVGESGCGKSTLARCISGVHAPEQGEILFRGRALADMRDRKARGRAIQMIFQDPYSSLNPRMTIAQTLDEVLRVHGLRPSPGARRERIAELLTMVGLSPALQHRLPHAFSGGQRQRISIARALAVEPDLIVADEPVSALDASVQAQIINLFIALQEKLGVSYVFVAHDLNVVRYVSQRVAVMYLGEIVESADADALFHHPRHPYTRALPSAIPVADPDRRSDRASLEGDPPDPLKPPPGCSFSSRCPMAVPLCVVESPLERLIDGHQVRCHRAEDMAAKMDVSRQGIATLSRLPGGDRPR